MKYSYHFYGKFENGNIIDIARIAKNRKEAASAVLEDLPRLVELEYIGRGYLVNGAIPFNSKMVRTVRPVREIVYSR